MYNAIKISNLNSFVQLDHCQNIVRYNVWVNLLEIQISLKYVLPVKKNLHISIIRKKGNSAQPNVFNIQDQKNLY